MTDADKILQIKCRGSSLAQIDELHEFQGDLKALSSDSLKKLEKVLLRHGFSEPIAVWRDGDKLCILNGHQRLIALKSLRSKGYHVPAIPIVEVDAKDAKEAKEKVLALTSQYGELSAKSVSDFMIASDVSLDFLNEHLRMPEVNFGKIQLQESASAGNEDEVPPVPPKVNIKLGDLFILGRHRLLCGDSTVITDVERLMNGEKADLVFTDPPYGIDLDTDYKSMESQNQSLRHERLTKNYKKVENDASEFNPAFIIPMADEVFIFGANYMTKYFDPNLGSWFVWDKRGESEGLNKMYGSSFELCWSKKKRRQEIARVTWAGFYGHNKKDDGASKVHPTMKPVKLIEWFFERIKSISVLDLFGGSGSTLIACEKTNRKCFMMELDPHYCGVILDRWQKFTGQQAMREDGRLWDEIKSE